MPAIDDWSEVIRNTVQAWPSPGGPPLELTRSGRATTRFAQRARHGPPRVAIRGALTTPWLARCLFGAPRFLAERICSRLRPQNQPHRRVVFLGLHYFFTYARHLEADQPGLLAAHKAHVEALRATGVTVHFGRFKRRNVRCTSCHRISFRHEEKETDVAMATALVELAVTRACDAIVLVSGDTDLLPAIRAARRLAPRVALWVAFPFGRSNRELAQVADGSFKLSHGQYAAHRLPRDVRVSDGRLCRKPAAW